MLHRRRAGKLLPSIIGFTLLSSAWAPASGAIVAESLHSDVRRLHSHTTNEAQVEATEPEEKAQRIGRRSAYRGLGTWVDMYDKPPWRDPERAVRRMKKKGVTTLYLQTANYAKPKGRLIYKPGKVARFITAAGARDIQVVAWYLPSFKNMRKDWRRTRAALRFKTNDGRRFDGFALDIESTKVRNITTRNRRLKTLSKRIRSRVGPDYALGAIVPDAYTSYWPSFPYRMVDRLYDVFLPMGYFSFRVKTKRGAYDYTIGNVRTIRQRTGNRKVKIHPIGGIAGRVGDPAARGYVRAVKDSKVMGGSYYDFPITTPSEWTILRRLAL